MISVIIPVYNIEQYLENTLNSLLAQTYKNLDIILINDGSSDNSVEICEKYAKKYDFINVIHKTNGGVSSARNCGLDIAKGEWIFFLDGDDILLNNAFSVLMQVAQESNCDIVEGNYIRILKGKPIYSPLLKEYYYEENSCSCINNTLLYNRCLVYPRLFKKKIIGNIRFKENIVIGEDILFIIELLLNKDVRIAHCKDIVYHYIQRSGSAMHNDKTMIHYETLSNEMKNKLEFKNEYIDSLILFCCINLYFKALKSGGIISKEEYNQYFKGHYSLFCKNRLLAVKFKLLFIAYSINRNLGNSLLKIRQIMLPKY